MFTKLVLRCGLAAAVTLGVAFASPVVSDANFSSPSLSAGSFEYAGTINASLPPELAWNFYGSTGVVSDDSAFGNVNAPDTSDQAGFVQGKGILSQILNWTGGTYTMSFDAALRSYDATLGPNSTPLYQSFDVVLTTGNTEVVLAQCGMNGTNGCTGLTTNYNEITLNPFTVTAGVHTIAFQGLTSASTAFITNVSFAQFQADPPLGVPEPSTFALLGLGAAGLIAFLRKRVVS